MKLSVSAYRAHASAHKKILSSSYHSQLNYGSTGAAAASSSPSVLYTAENSEHIAPPPFAKEMNISGCNSDTDVISPTGTSSSGQDQPTSGAVRKSRSHKHHHDDDNNSNAHSSESRSPTQKKSGIGDGASDPDSDWNRSNQRWMKLRTTVQISSAIQKKPPLKREDSFLKRFSTRQIPETQETVEDTGSESASGDVDKTVKRRRRYLQKRRSVVNPDENFYFYWLMLLCLCVLYNLWTLIVRQSFPELQKAVPTFWFICDTLTDIVFICDIFVQLRTGYLEQGLMVYDDKKLACHYVHSRDFILDMVALIPFDLLQLRMGIQPLLRFTRFFKVYRSVKFYYIVESRTVWPNLWRVVNLIHILLILAHWFGCFYYLLSEAEGFQGDWVYPYRPGDYATLTRKYLGSLYWSTLTLTTIGDLPTPETNAEYVFTIVSYLIGVFIFATIVGQVGNVITNRNANRLEFERLLDGAKTYMRHHKVPGGMKRRVLRWYDYSWSRGRIQGGGDINTALGLLPDKLKTELALHVNLSVLKKVTIFQECQPEFLHDLVLKMKAYIFTPGDSICRKGEVAREMFIIADGILEVISETGKVLTTMKAGDFFGEIGILNLDGLNKRTADVRSVGYSELFSLSREDVLAAMKDYPEAQEILQTLGRKRLMEVRCVNKKYRDKENAAAAAAAAAAQTHTGHVNQSDSSENSASKKIVEKFRSDVKGIRNVLKKTRPSRRSDESLEMQPLQNTSPKNGKSMLKRMSRVRSDEKDDKEAAEERDEFHDKTPSPIGAGLPLLQRLRLLKEKQDREERAVKSATQQKSPPHSHTVTCTLSPQESIQEEPEREINEGLPLIQRLQQLKIKNDAPTTSDTSKLVGPSCSSDSISFVTHPTTTDVSSGVAVTSLTPLSHAIMKPTMKVSFRQRIQQMQSPAPSTAAASNGAAAGLKTAKAMTKESAGSTGAIGKKDPPKTLSVPSLQDIEENVPSRLQKPIATISNKIMKPSIITSSVISETDTDTDTPSIKPWSKLKLATLISSSYTSLTNCAADDIDMATKNFSLGNIPRMMADDNGSMVIRAPSATNRRHNTESSTNTSTTTSTATGLEPNLDAQMVGQTKFYDSVFDLSPEYSGLPFVKRLKILNERQKLVELETALQTRSFSLDSSKQNNCPPISESLYRCYSDTSGIYSQYLSAYETSSTASTTSTSTTSENSRKQPLHFVKHEYSPLSPESNETMERRKLKSILKKLHKSQETAYGVPDLAQDDAETRRKHYEGLLREPTLEGPPSSVKACTFDENTYETTASATAAVKKTAAATTITTKSSISPVSPLILTPKNSPQDPTTSPKCNSYATTTTTTPTPTTENVEGLNINIYNSNRNINSNYSVFATSSTNEFDFQNSTNKETPKLEGFPEAHEYFNQILCGVNHVITMHMNAMHTKFQSQFSSMACEVQRRDAIIKELQMQLQNMELRAVASGTGATRRKTNSRTKMNKITDQTKSDDNDSSGSSAELLFMRGDSLDTVFTSSPPMQRKSYSNSPCTSRAAPEYSATISSTSSHQNYTKLSSSYAHGHGSYDRKAKAWNESDSVMLSDVTGNLRSADSVILDIGESSSSSSSSNKLNIDDDEYQDDDDDDVEDDETPSRRRAAGVDAVHHNDWEVRMLAAEMERQERKRGYSLTENSSEHLKQSLLRRRRKFSDTETEYSDPDAVDIDAAHSEQSMAAMATRPRASSLDQFNLRYGIGSRIFKAMSTDRDKDKL